MGESYFGIQDLETVSKGGCLTCCTMIQKVFWSCRVISFSCLRNLKNISINWLELRCCTVTKDYRCRVTKRLLRDCCLNTLYFLLQLATNFGPKHFGFVWLNSLLNVHNYQVWKIQFQIPFGHNMVWLRSKFACCFFF